MVLGIVPGVCAGFELTVRLVFIFVGRVPDDITGGLVGIVGIGGVDGFEGFDPTHLFIIALDKEPKPPVPAFSPQGAKTDDALAFCHLIRAIFVRSPKYGDSIPGEPAPEPATRKPLAFKNF